MSQILHFELGTPTTPLEQVNQQVRAIADSRRLVADVNRTGNVLVTPSGLVVGPALELTDLSDQFLRHFGIERSAHLDLETGGAEREAQVRDAVTIVLQLLAQIPDDAALHFEYYDVWLVRQAGQLWLSDRDDLWEPDLLALVSLPHQRTALTL